MGKFTCPYCYAEHDVTGCKLRCSYNNAKNAGKRCKDGNFKKNRDGWIYDSYKKDCLKCREAALHLYCKEAEKEIPREFLDVKSLPVALLGAKASGKSNYIAVLVNEIRNKMLKPFNCSLSMASCAETKEAYYENYYRPLFEQGYAVKVTDAGVTPVPLIFPLTFMDGKNRITKMTALTFYDTAGENLDSQTVMHTFNKYISNAKGIILLLDPLQISGIREQLAANGFSGLPAQNTDTYTVLDTVVTVLRSVKKLKGNIEIPLALVFTKIDVLEEYNVLPADSCLRNESEHLNHGCFNLQDFQNTNIHLKDLIDNWISQELLQLVKQFKYHSFFGATALGVNPKGGTKIETAIKPRRVLDPLLWLLAENKYIKTVRR